MRLLIYALQAFNVGASASLLDQIPFFHSNHEVITRPPGNHSITRDFYLELEELSRLVDITYCVGIHGPGVKAPFECPSHCKDFPNVELVTTWNTGPLLSDSCGYVAVEHANKTLSKKPRVIVAFRGTYSIANTVYDLSTIPQEYVPYPDDGGNGKNPNATKCESCSVHMGFYASWKNTRKVILPVIERIAEENPDHQLVLVGHSLGGAVAALAGMELLARGFDPMITTFGEPRIGNQGLSDFIDAQFGLSNSSTSGVNLKFRRVTHVADPVPHLPLEEWGYKPHSGEIYISKSDLPPEVSDLRFCEGQKDEYCSLDPEGDWTRFPYGLPARFKIWELLWSHRDYFWRLGLCLGHEHDGVRLRGEF